MIPQHLSLFTEHGTPPYIADAAREVMGGIDCDPASCTEANKVIRALTYFEPPQDGMLRDWDGRVFLNPPGGSLVMTKKVQARLELSDEEADELGDLWNHQAREWKTKSRAVMWWRKLTVEYLEGRAREGVFVGFNLDILQASQCDDDEWPDVLKFPMCVPHKRIPFLNGGVVGKEPTHGNVVVYLPNKPGDSRKFERVFSAIGSVAI